MRVNALCGMSPAAPSTVREKSHPQNQQRFRFIAVPPEEDRATAAYGMQRKFSCIQYMGCADRLVVGAFNTI